MPNISDVPHSDIQQDRKSEPIFRSIIFDRSITFSYKIRRFPVTLKPVWKHGLYLVLNTTDKKFTRAESAYSVVENYGVNMERAVICQWHSHLFGLLQIDHSLPATEHKGHRLHPWIQDAFHSEQMPDINKKFILRILHSLNSSIDSMGSILQL